MLPFDPSQYKYFLFDWDGCLAKTLHSGLRDHRKVLAEFGVNATDTEVARYFGDPHLPAHFGIADGEQFWQRLRVCALDWARDADLYTGAAELLAYAKQHGKVAIVSSQGSEALLAGIQRHGLDTIVDLVISGDDVAEYKPDPQGIEMALKHFDANASKAIMIGDTEKDILAAHNAGIDSLLVYPDEHAVFYDYDALVAHKPTYIARGIHTIECR